jgi:hypothetical protein
LSFREISNLIFLSGDKSDSKTAGLASGAETGGICFLRRIKIKTAEKIKNKTRNIKTGLSLIFTK